MSIKLKTSLDNCNISDHYQFYNAFHIRNHIIIHFIPAHIINSSNGEQAASSISQTRRKTLTAQLNITLVQYNISLLHYQPNLTGQTWPTIN